MNTMPTFCRRLAVGAAVTLLATAVSAAEPDEVTPSASDVSSARAATGKFHHLRPSVGPLLPATKRSERAPAASAGASAAAAPFSTGPRYPGDLTYHGGAVVKTVVSHPIYLDGTGACGASCWGDPERFLQDLGKSDFIHLVDDFVGAERDGRYTVVPGKKASAPGGTLLTDNDILGVVHAAAVASGKTGYGHIYHVFLTPGTDLCFDDTFSVCYSPDVGATFYFCAYHGSVNFADIGHVLYSAEPYQNVRGCQARPGSPNGPLIDSTNNVLSHEVFEAITDPDGDAWWNSTDNANYGNENGDECSYIAYVAPHYYFDPSLWSAGGRIYATQPEYSNTRHACLTEP